MTEYPVGRSIILFCNMGESDPLAMVEGKIEEFVTFCLTVFSLQCDVAVQPMSDFEGNDSRG